MDNVSQYAYKQGVIDAKSGGVVFGDVALRPKK